VHPSPVLNKFGNGISIDTHALEVHLVLVLPSSLRREMVDRRRGVQVQLLEDLWSVLIIDNSEVGILSVEMCVAVGIRDDQKLLVNRSE